MEFLPEIKKIFERYDLELRGIKSSFGLKTEAECLMGRPRYWPTYLRDRGKASKSIHRKVNILQLEMRELFVEKYSKEEMREKAASSSHISSRAPLF